MPEYANVCENVPKSGWLAFALFHHCNPLSTWMLGYLFQCLYKTWSYGLKNYFWSLVVLFLITYHTNRFSSEDVEDNNSLLLFQESETGLVDTFSTVEDEKNLLCILLIFNGCLVTWASLKKLNLCT